MRTARNLATAAVTGTILSAGLLTGPAQAADSFTLCLPPSTCASASVTGTVDWTAGNLTATGVNNAYTSVTVTVSTTSRVTRVSLARGVRRTFTQTIAATDQSLTVRLCAPSGTCNSVTLTRP
ncbi:hypothetical protein AB0G04_15270 [Actinoplanes sp. NPDC023801]|uniref:hypothetical protein n=1 Tax=Actinoplanes sp. NPDC023801 TaxID=3154595 RepID=UPI0033F96774